MSTDTIVDIYCHIFPDAFFQEMNRIRRGSAISGRACAA